MLLFYRKAVTGTRAAQLVKHLPLALSSVYDLWVWRSSPALGSTLGGVYFKILFLFLPLPYPRSYSLFFSLK